MALSDAAHSQGQDAVIHHAANAAAIAMPVGAVVFHLPEAIAIITGLLGAVWYTILIAEKIMLWRIKWKQTQQSATRVAVKLQEDRYGEVPPSDD